MKPYPVLYTRDTIGNVRVWYMQQENNKHRTVSGLLDGERVTSEWTITETKNSGKKNATTATEQARAEIESRYKKQRKTGYFDDVGDIGSTFYVEPMLAKLYKDYAHKIDLSSGEWLLQCKFNGMRCVATKDGLFTRKGEKYLSVPHVENSLKPFFKKYPNAVLDGELFNNELRQQLNEISKLIRKTVHISKEDLERSEELVRYYVYDGYGFGLKNNLLNQNESYKSRKEWIDNQVVGEYDYVVHVTDTEILSQINLDEAYQSLIDDGQEGGILRYKNMKYENKRSKNLLKVKPEDDDEGEIVEVTEGAGNWRGTGKIITLKWKDKTFDATFKGTHEQATLFLKEKNKWIGKKVTFLYNGLTGLGTPNYARVDINNCIKGDR